MPSDRQWGAVGVLLAVASILFTISGIQVNGVLGWFVFGIAVAFALTAMWLLLPAGARLRLVGLSTLLPLCKSNLQTVWKVCVRCAGFYLGVACSVLLVYWTHKYPDFMGLLGTMNPWAMLLLSAVFTFPTAWHGTKRRLASDPLPHPFFRFAIGLFSGLGFFTAYLAFKGFFG